LTKFTDLGLAERLLRAISEEGYETPTPVQAGVIPAMLDGRDVVGIAQTGTGKTAAFVLPLLQEILTRKGRNAPRTCAALILAPTRELANQIDESIRTYGRHVRHSTAVVIGGARPGPQVRAMARGVDIVIATPGRLLDHMSTGAIKLDETTSVVLDEGDQMLDLGFMPAIRKIMAKLPRDRRTVLLSATMPKQIRALADDFLTDPLEVSVTPAARPIEKIDQRVVMVEKSGKRDALVDALSGPEVESAIVFTRTKRGADRVCRNLEEADIAAGAIHGNKSQNQRERTLSAFKKGRIRVLVATDIAARGIDIDGVTHVVNFELPNVPESYVHRIGRTARAGAAGTAIALCDSEEIGLLRDIEKLIGNPIPKVDKNGEAVADLPERTGGKGGKSGIPRRKSGGGRRFGPKPAANGNAAGNPAAKHGNRPGPKSGDGASAENRKKRRKRRPANRNASGPQVSRAA
jgi:ATP-dependent RNA helicase RhlE